MAVLTSKRLIFLACKLIKRLLPDDLLTDWLSLLATSIGLNNKFLTTLLSGGLATKLVLSLLLCAGNYGPIYVGIFDDDLWAAYKVDLKTFGLRNEVHEWSDTKYP